MHNVAHRQQATFSMELGRTANYSSTEIANSIC